MENDGNCLYACILTNYDLDRKWMAELRQTLAIALTTNIDYYCSLVNCKESSQKIANDIETLATPCGHLALCILNDVLAVVVHIFEDSKGKTPTKIMRAGTAISQVYYILFIIKKINIMI